MISRRRRIMQAREREEREMQRQAWANVPVRPQEGRGTPTRRMGELYKWADGELSSGNTTMSLPFDEN